MNRSKKSNPHARKDVKFNANRRIVITAGPTREYIDPVRYLSNDSSGLMGFELARVGTSMGYDVTLIAGPVSIKTPHGVKKIDVTSASDMFKSVKKHAKDADIFISAAAVADYSPEKKAINKIKKANKNITLKLKKNPDILSNVGNMKRGRPNMVVGFALETENLIKNASKKLEKKNCDWIIANRASSINALQSKVIMISKNREVIKLPPLPKGSLAIIIMSYLLT